MGAAPGQRAMKASGVRRAIRDSNATACIEANVPSLFSNRDFPVQGPAPTPQAAGRMRAPPADQIRSPAGLAQHLKQHPGGFPQQLDPVAQIGRMALDLAAHLQPLAQQHGAQLGHELLTGIAGAAHPSAEIALQARRMAGGVNRLVGPGGIERRGGMEGGAIGKLNPIGPWQVEGAIAAMAHGHAPGREGGFRRAEPLRLRPRRSRSGGGTPGDQLVQGPGTLGITVEISGIEEGHRPEGGPAAQYLLAALLLLLTGVPLGRRMRTALEPLRGKRPRFLASAKPHQKGRAEPRRCWPRVSRIGLAPL